MLDDDDDDELDRAAPRDDDDDDDDGDDEPGGARGAAGARARGGGAAGAADADALTPGERLLEPLTRTVLFHNPTALNKRQAAAILGHLADAARHAAVPRQLAKRLKEFSVRGRAFRRARARAPLALGVEAEALRASLRPSLPLTVPFPLSFCLVSLYMCVQAYVRAACIDRHAWMCRGQAHQAYHHHRGV